MVKFLTGEKFRFSVRAQRCMSLMQQSDRLRLYSVICSTHDLDNK